MNTSERTQLKSMLWPRDRPRPVPVYAVIDCAQSPAVYNLVQRSYRDKACLFSGNLAPVLQQAAPYLLHLEPRDNVTDELLLTGWRNSWASLIRVDASFNNVRRHLRKFLRVTDENRSNLLFRFYDPRVLRRFLPTCSVDQLATMFALEGLDYIVPDTQPGHAIRFSCTDENSLTTQQVSLRANNFNDALLQKARST